MGKAPKELQWWLLAPSGPTLGLLSRPRGLCSCHQGSAWSSAHVRSTSCRGSIR